MCVFIFIFCVNVLGYTLLIHGGGVSSYPSYPTIAFQIPIRSLCTPIRPGLQGRGLYPVLVQDDHHMVRKGEAWLPMFPSFQAVSLVCIWEGTTKLFFIICFWGAGHAIFVFFALGPPKKKKSKGFAINFRGTTFFI